MNKNSDKLSFDIVVVGGGASGMMAAFWAAQKGTRVAIIEKNDELGKKVLATGKGRCNITQENFNQDNLLDVFGKNGRFLFSALREFSVKKTKDFFEKNGLKLKTERGGRVFPKADDSREVISFFKKLLVDNGVVFL
jgi:hypothetical protein